MPKKNISKFKRTPLGKLPMWIRQVLGLRKSLKFYLPLIKTL